MEVGSSRQTEKEEDYDSRYTDSLSTDDAGRELLDNWRAQGARFVAISSEAQARVQSMIGRPITVPGTNPKAFTWILFRTSALWLAILVVLLFPRATSAAALL